MKVDEVGCADVSFRKNFEACEDFYWGRTENSQVNWRTFEVLCADTSELPKNLNFTLKKFNSVLHEVSVRPLRK